MLASKMEQFGAATAQVMRHVEAVAQRLSLCRRAFGESMAEVAALNDAHAGVYRVDVGGVVFHSHREVLQSHGGMLSAMVAFSHDVEVFLDRDPMWFPQVLDFLRTGHALVPADAARRASLYREARYYSLDGLCWATRPPQERLVIMGGDICEMYNPLQQSWAWVERFNVARGNVWVSGDGGFFALQARADPRLMCRVFPTLGGWGWEDIPTSFAQTYRWGTTMAYHDGRLYGTYDVYVQYIDTSDGRWNQLPVLSNMRTWATMCVLNGRLFVIGGATAAVEEYVAVERRWVSVPDMPRAICFAAAVAWEGKMLVIGGVCIETRQFLSVVLEYTPEDGIWRELPSLCTARGCCAATVYQGEVVALGGIGPGDESLASVERYNRRLQRWEAMPSLTGPLPFLAAAVVHFPGLTPTL